LLLIQTPTEVTQMTSAIEVCRPPPRPIRPASWIRNADTDDFQLSTGIPCPNIHSGPKSTHSCCIAGCNFVDRAPI